MKQRKEKKSVRDAQLLQNHLDALVESIPGNYWCKDKKGVYQSYNTRLLHTMGLTSFDQVIGKTDFELPWADQAETLVKNDQYVLSTGKTHTFEEKVAITPDTVKIFLVSKTPLRDAKNEIIGTIGTSFDITELRNTQRQLEIEKTNAETANQAKTQFMHNIRHDFRTPFSGILSIAEAMIEQDAYPELKEQLQIITHSAQSLLRMLNQIFEVIENEKGTRMLYERPFSLLDCLQDIETSLKPAIEAKKLCLSMHVDNQIPHCIIGDEVALRSILMNLLGNAVKFTPHGEIKLWVAKGPIKNERLIIRFKVSDTGIGISKDHYKIIFQRFSRIEASHKGHYQGLGIGLSIVKNLVSLMEGDINVSSTLNQGTTFTFNLPFTLPLVDSQEPWPNDERMQVLSNNSTLNEGKLQERVSQVLIVEDHPVAQMAAKLQFEKYAEHIDLVSDGKQAIEHIKQYQYDLVVLDIGLPDINGFEVAKIARIELGFLGVISGLTAHLKEEQAQRTKHIDLMFEKPVNSTQIRDMLVDVFKRKQGA